MMSGTMMGGYGPAWWMIGLMIVFGVFAFVAAVALGAILVAWLRHNRVDTVNQRRGARLDQLPPLDILRERYARGEIDTTTFEEQVTRLESERMSRPFAAPVR